MRCLTVFGLQLTACIYMISVLCSLDVTDCTIWGWCKYAVAKSPNDEFLQMDPRQPHVCVHVWVCCVYVGRVL